jgi:hypothetical protein
VGQGLSAPTERQATPVQQSHLFSRKRWVMDRFCRAQIEASPALQVMTLTAG